MSEEFRKLTGKAVRYMIPLAVSAGLLLWLFHKVDFKEMMAVIREGCDFRYIVIMMLITALSHVIRGIRWGIQLRGAGVPRMPVIAESVSIFGAYALNLVFSGVGEAWRCIYVSRRESVPLSTVVGTDIGDRISDAIVVLALFGVALVVAHGPLTDFISHYVMGKDLAHFSENPWLWCAMALAIVVVVTLFRFFKKYRYIDKIDEGLKNVWHGFKVMFTMKGAGCYVILTLCIWVCYFMETYVCFYAFPFTRRFVTEPGTAFGLIPGLVVFVFGSFSMAVPSNGGLGPWNLAVMFALSIYGVSNTEGAAFSMVMWGFQAIMLILLGIFSAVYVTCTKRKLVSSK